MINLSEAKYEDIFSPETLEKLKGKSGESLQQLIGDKNLMQTMRESQELLMQIAQAERGFEENLVKVAIDIVKQAYPIVEYSDIRIEASLGSGGDIQEPEDDDNDDDGGGMDTMDLEKKRRIINGITQGASIRGSFSFLLFREHLDEIDNSLVEKYNQILKLSFGIYDNEEAIAMMLSLLGQGQKQQGGESKAEYDEEADQFVVKAQAICFPMLVHEIVKGLYEIIGTEGFGSDRELNKQIIGKVDKLSNEPEDLRYGKFIYDGLRELYLQTEWKDDRSRELFFTEVYKLNNKSFFSLINAIINDTINNIHINWAKEKVREIEKDAQSVIKVGGQGFKTWINIDRDGNWEGQGISYVKKLNVDGGSTNPGSIDYIPQAYKDYKGFLMTWCHLQELQIAGQLHVQQNGQWLNVSNYRSVTSKFAVPYCGFNTLKEFGNGHKLEAQKKGGAYRGGSRTDINHGFVRYRVVLDGDNNYPPDNDYSVMGINSHNGSYEPFLNSPIQPEEANITTTPQKELYLGESFAGEAYAPAGALIYAPGSDPNKTYKLQEIDYYSNSPQYNHHPAGFGQGFANLLKYQTSAGQKYFDVQLGWLVDNSHLKQAFFAVIRTENQNNKERGKAS